MKMVVLLFFSLLGSCSTLEKRDKTFVATAFSFNLFGLQIPENPHVRIEKILPKEKKEIKTLIASPNNFETLPGIILRVIGLSYIQIAGELLSSKRS